VSARIFIPGYGALPGFYRAALRDTWAVHEAPAFSTCAGFAEHVASLRARMKATDRPLILAGHSLGAAVAVAASLHAPDLVERLVLIGPAGLPLTKPILDSLRELRAQARAGAYPRGELRRAVLAAARAPASAWRLAQAVRALDLREELAAVRRAGIPCEVIACTGDTLTTVEHCRRVARLTGGVYRQLDARGGHMWPVVDPGAFAAITA
jgi:pimeloyl-ACP methyl ester carboxylesterase